MDKRQNRLIWAEVALYVACLIVGWNLPSCGPDTAPMVAGSTPVPSPVFKSTPAPSPIVFGTPAPEAHGKCQKGRCHGKH